MTWHRQNVRSEVKKCKQSAINIWHVVILGTIMLSGFTLRFYQLGDDSLWADEIGQVRVAELSFPEILKGIKKHHGAAPLDYLLLHFWVKIGKEDFLIRIPSALYSVLTIAVIYKLGERLFGPNEGLIAAFLLAISVFHIQYAQEVRFYALSSFLTTLLLLIFHDAVLEGRQCYWIVYFSVALASLYTYYFAAIIIGLQFITLIVVKVVFGLHLVSNKLVLRIVVGLCVVGSLFLPWFLYDLPYQQGHSFGPPKLSSSILVEIVSSFTGFSSFQWEGYLFLVVFLVGFIRMLHGIQQKPLWILILFIVIFSPLIILGIDIVFSYFFAVRQMLIVLPAVLLTVSYGATSILTFVQGASVDKRWIRCVVAMLILLVLFLGAGNFTQLSSYYAREKEDWRELAEFFRVNVFPENKITSPLLFYVEYYYPEVSKYRVNNVPHSIESTEIGDLLGETGRLWSINSLAYPHVSPGENFKSWMFDIYNGFWEFQFSSFEIYYTGSGVCQYELSPPDIRITDDIHTVIRHCK